MAVHSEPVPISYDDALTGNLRAARSRARLSQASVVTRMRNLGFDQWHRQTVGKIERGERRVMAGEILGLSLALEASIGVLLAPAPDDLLIALPAGQLVDRMTMLRSIKSERAASVVRWEGDEPHFESVEVGSLATPESIATHQDPFTSSEAR